MIMPSDSALADEFSGKVKVNLAPLSIRRRVRMGSEEVAYLRVGLLFA
jgi:hypothetical protein